jgi:hypothetical protein
METHHVCFLKLGVRFRTNKAAPTTAAPSGRGRVSALGFKKHDLVRACPPCVIFISGNHICHTAFYLSHLWCCVRVVCRCARRFDFVMYLSFFLALGTSAGTMSRQIFSTYEKGKLQIKYHATVADEIDCAHKMWGCCCPCTCMCYGPLSKGAYFAFSLTSSHASTCRYFSSATILHQGPTRYWSLNFL